MAEYDGPDERAVREMLGDINADAFAKIDADAQKALKMPKATRGRGNKKRGTTAAARMWLSLDLIARCRAASVPPPESVVRLLASVAETKVPKLSKEQSNIAAVDAQHWPEVLKLREAAKQAGCSYEAVNKFRRHQAYGKSVELCVAAEIENKLSSIASPPKRGWDDIINIEAKIRQWTEAQEYPFDPSTGIDRTFSNANELAQYIIDNRVLPGVIADQEAD
jgi:hypothetical protein